MSEFGSNPRENPNWKQWTKYFLTATGEILKFLGRCIDPEKKLYWSRSNDRQEPISTQIIAHNVSISSNVIATTINQSSKYKMCSKWCMDPKVTTRNIPNNFLKHSFLQFLFFVIATTNPSSKYIEILHCNRSSKNQYINPNHHDLCSNAMPESRASFKSAECWNPRSWKLQYYQMIISLVNIIL